MSSPNSSPVSASLSSPISSPIFSSPLAPQCHLDPKLSRRKRQRQGSRSRRTSVQLFGESAIQASLLRSDSSLEGVDWSDRFRRQCLQASRQERRSWIQSTRTFKHQGMEFLPTSYWELDDAQEEEDHMQDRAAARRQKFAWEALAPSLSFEEEEMDVDHQDGIEEQPPSDFEDDLPISTSLPTVCPSCSSPIFLHPTTEALCCQSTTCGWKVERVALEQFEASWEEHLACRPHQSLNVIAEWFADPHVGTVVICPDSECEKEWGF